jgi:hypothetical protein
MRPCECCLNWKNSASIGTCPHTGVLSSTSVWENRDEAVRWLEQVIADHDGLNINMIKVDPWLDPLRGDPRFEVLVQKVVGPKLN